MKKHHNIECLRFVFSVIIVYFHILHSNIIPYTEGNGVYLELQYMCRMSYTLVDAFLIIGGYFIYTSWEKKPDKAFIEFALNRFFRIWPVFAFYTVCITWMGGDISEGTLLDLALLRSTGLSLEFTEIIWYVAPFFWCSLLVYAILKNCRKGTAAFVLVLIAYFGYLINLNYLDGGAGCAVIWDALSLAMLRVAGGIGIGVLIAMSLSELSRVYGIKSAEYGYCARVLFSIGEAFCIILLLSIVLLRRPFIKNIFSVVVIFSVLFVCFVNQCGDLSRVLNRPVFSQLGKYAYSIYVMQQVSFDLMEKTFWQNTAFIRDHEFLALLASVAFSVFVGVATYHIIERPAYLIFKKWESVHRREEAYGKLGCS